VPATVRLRMFRADAISRGRLNRSSMRIGAQIDDLIDGVKGAKEAIESIGESTDKVSEGFKTLAEAVGVSLSIEGFKSFVENMAELGSHTEDSMARLGQSAEQITTLQGVASVAGISFEGLQQSIEKASLNIQKSTKDGYNPAAQALKVLGLNARQLTGIPADQWFNKIADAVSRFNPSLNLTNAVTAAFGRGTAQMLPLLLQGSEHFQELSAAVKKAQEGLAAAIPGMDNTHEKISLMTASVQGLGGRIFSVLKPSIDSAIKSFTAWVQSIDSKTIAKAVTEIVQYSTEAMLSIGNMSIGLLESFAAVSGGLDPLIKKIEVLALGAALGQMMGGLKGAIVGAGLASAVSLFVQEYSKIPVTAAKVNVNLDAQREKLASIVAAIRAQFANLNLTPPKVTTGGNGKQDAGGIDAAAKDEMGARASRIEAAISAEQAKFAQIKEILNQEASAYKITEQQKAIYTETALQQMYEAEMASIEKKILLYPKDTKAYEDVQKEKAKLTQEYQTQMVSTVDASQKEMVQTVQGYLQTITGSFNSSLKGLITGTTSWAQAMQNITSGLFMKMIEGVENWAVKHASVIIGDSLLQKTQSASDVMTAAAAEAAKTEAAVAGAAARAAAETTGASAGIATQIGAAITSIGIDAGKVFAGVFGFLAPVMGPAAAGPAGASAAETLAAGMAPLAVGAWEIPSVMPALLHPGEMVIPANFASGIRSASAGGGGQGGAGTNVGISMNVSAFNPAGMQATINAMMPQLARALQRYQSLNPSTN
jgi:hypothetical protein